MIGAGVVGAAVAARLSQEELRVVWLEAAHDVAEGASKGNSAITASGYDCAPGMLEAELVTASSPRWDAICAELDVPFRRVGCLVLAFTGKEEARLAGLHEGQRHQHHDHRDDIGDRPLARPYQFLQHPDRQGRLLAGGEGGDDHLVEAQREGEHAARQQRRGEIGQDDVAEGLEAVGAEVHRRFDQRSGCAGSGRRRCCRRRRRRRSRGRARWSRSRREYWRG